MRAACHRSYGKGMFPGGRVNRIKGAKMPGKMKAKVATDFTTMGSPVTLATAIWWHGRDGSQLAVF